MSTADPLAELAQASVRVGSDPLLVQGPGGNTSRKIDGVLWVKASGQWLAEALDRPIFVPLSLSGVRVLLATGEGDAFGSAVLTALAQPGHKPSIETGMHAAMPHPVVLHAHSVNVMATMALADGETRAAQALSGLASGFIAYRRPGAPLAASFGQALARERLDIVLLGNHGVTVGADTATDAEALLLEVERRLALPAAALPAFDAAAAIAGETDIYEVDLENSGVALDPWLTAALGDAPRIPDQVVFTGGAVPLAEPDGLDAAAAAVTARTGVAPALVLVPGVGAYRRRDRSRAGDAVIDGLLQLTRRLPRGADLVGLDAAAAAELLGWDAEHYRQSLDRAKG